MVALNVSSDVLSGFKHVEDAMDASNEGTQKRNAKLFDEFTALHNKNAEKTGAWYIKAKEARRESARKFAQLDSLKLEIVKKADGKRFPQDSEIPSAIERRLKNSRRRTNT